MGRLVDHSVQDRRASRRHGVKTPIRVRPWKSTIPEHAGESENIAQDGMCFATDLALSVGKVVEVLLKMTEEVTGESAAEWRCTGHAVRVETVKLPGREQLVRVQFDCYQVSKA
jgi:hypothetical protein